jgi:hypothetical protein
MKFELNEREQETAKKWRHPCWPKKQAKAHNPEYTFGNGSGIGRHVYIRCMQCGVTKDITDYESW